MKGDPPQSGRTRLLIRSSVGLGAAVLIALVWLTLVGRGVPDGMAEWFGLAMSFIALAAFLFSGAVILFKQPGNVIGWLLMVPGLIPPIAELCQAWLTSLDPPPTTVDLGLWLALWFTSWSWIPLIFPIFLILLTFPHGRLLSTRWRWVVVLLGLMTATMMGLTAFADRMEVMIEDETVWSISNPIGIFGYSDQFDQVFSLIWSPLLLVVTIASVAAVILRYRRGTWEEREQLKWPLWGVLLFGVIYGLGAMAQEGPSGLVDVLFYVGLAAIPASVAIAILKYHLFEIDRIVSRTVTYGVVVGLSAAVFYAVVTALSLLPTAKSDLTIAASTLAVFVLFSPLRRWVQRWVDRRFNRSHYDARRLADEFAQSLRDQIDGQELVAGWVGVISDTMQPTALGVWVRETKA